MKKKKERVFLIVTLLFCAVLFAERLTGEIWHAVIGVLLTVLVVGHVGKQIAKMRYRSLAIRIIDEVLLVALFVIFLTGMLMHPLQGVLAVKILHKLSSAVFVLGTFGHVLQHRTDGAKSESENRYAKTQKKEICTDEG